MIRPPAIAATAPPPLGLGDYAIWAMLGLLFVSVDNWLRPRVAIESLGDTGEGSALRQIVYIALLGAGLVLVLRRHGPAILPRLMPVPLMLLFLWAAISLTWSAVPMVGMRRLALTAITALSIMAIARIVPPAVLVTRFRQVVLALGAVSLLAVLALPELAIHQPSDPESAVIGDWRGVFYHKNLFGAVLAPGILVCLHAALTSQGRPRRRALVQTVFLAALLWQSGSKTPFGLVLGLGLLLWLLMGLRRQRGQIGLVLALLAGALAALGVGLMLYVGMTGAEFYLPDDALTGRGRIWNGLYRLSEGHALTGYGFQSIFQVGFASPLMGLFSDRFSLTLSHAHNAYLEIYLTLGLVGLGLFLWAVAIHPLRLALLDALSAQRAPDGIGALAMVVILFTLIHNLLEVGLFDRDRQIWIVFLLFYALLWRRRAPAPLQQALP